MPPRPLPRSLDPLLEEALDGFLLRLSYRLERSPSRLAAVTGLTCKSVSRLIRADLLMHLPDRQRDIFARATRLSTSEVADLCLSSMSDRYPPVSSAPEARGWHHAAYRNHWVFLRATRYCPQCLIGDASAIHEDLGGGWRKAWRLPIVFACTRHGRFLEHLCPGCGRPARNASAETTVSVIPQPGRVGLHPAQCRLPLPESKLSSRAAPACGTTLSARLLDPSLLSRNDDAIVLQQRINNLLDPNESGMTVSVGAPATASQYFVDLRLLTHLIRASWPRAQDLVKIPEPFMTALNQNHQQERQEHQELGAAISRMHDTPPLDARTCAAMLMVAARLLECPHTQVTEHVRHLLSYDQRPPGKATWTRRVLGSQPAFSPGLRQALAPVLQTFAPLPRGRIRKAIQNPIRRTRYKPEHVAQFLHDDWYKRYFASMDGINPTHLRRAAAIHLCQLAAGGSVSKAANLLGVPDERAQTSTKYVQRWARRRPEPREFETALHNLANELDSAQHLIDYQRRREVLRGWCLDHDTWEHLLSRLPPRAMYTSRIELGDRKRQTASILVWARVTQGEHVLAPHPIRDQLPPKVRDAWRLSAYATWARFQKGQARHHERDLKRVLDQYADALAACIDRSDPA
jgi:hypothetical protein